MNWMTIAWSMAGGMCLLLGLINLFFSILKKEEKIPYLLSGMMCLSAVASAMIELLLMNTSTVEVAAKLFIAANYNIFILLMSMVWLVHLRMSYSRKWLLCLISILWVTSLVINFFSPYSLTYASLESMVEVPTFGGLSFFMAKGLVHPLKFIPDICSFLILIYFFDAVILGIKSKERRKSITLGLSAGVFILIGGVHTPLVDAGIIQTPFLVTFAFLSMVIFMSYDLFYGAILADEYKRHAFESTVRWERFVQSAPLIVVECDVDGHIVYVNPYTCSLAGYEKKELFSIKISFLLEKINRPLLGEIAKKEDLRSPQDEPLETILLSKKGEERHIRVIIVPVKQQDSITSFIIIGRDITEELDLNLKLNEARSNIERMNRVNIMGEMSAMLAHELNQPLATILSNAQAAQRFILADSFDKSELIMICEDIIQQDRRATAILSNIRQMVEKSNSHLQPLSISTILNQTVNLMGKGYDKHKAEIHLELCESDCEVNGTLIGMQQILINLIINSVTAMDEAGTIQPTVNIKTSQEETNIIIFISDSGQGICEEEIGKVFEPFYTTGSKNIGMGLTISRRLAEEYGGTLMYKKETNVDGFELSFPIIKHLPHSDDER